MRRRGTRRDETKRVQLVKVEGERRKRLEGRERKREKDRVREARDGVSPVCQPASLVYAPGHPSALQVAVSLRLLNKRGIVHLWLFIAINIVDCENTCDKVLKTIRYVIHFVSKDSSRRYSCSSSSLSTSARW